MKNQGQKPKGWWTRKPVSIRAAIIGAAGLVIAALVGLIPPVLSASSSRPQGQTPVTASHSSPSNSRTSPATRRDSRSLRTWTETAYTASKTFADFVSAGGPFGASLSARQAVQVSCRVKGFKVADGDRWWYRLASSPWNGQYYATTDNFWNTPRPIGNPINGIAFDKRVPVCSPLE